MPSVPRYSLPQVSEIAQPQVRSSTDAPISAFGGGQAAAQVTKAQIQAIDIFAKAKDDADETIANDALLRARKERYRLTLDPNEGALNKKGKNAVHITDEYSTKYGEFGQQIEGELENDNQRRHFRIKFDGEQAGFNEDLQKHSLREVQAYEDETSKALVKSYQDEGLLAYNDVNKVRESIFKQENEIERQGARGGKDSVTIELEKKEASSSTNLGVVRSYLQSNNDMTAKKYFDANKDSFLPEHKAALEKELEEGSLRGESQRRSDAIFVKHKDDMTLAIEEAKKIQDPKLRDETVSRVKDNFSLKNAAEREDEENLYKRAGNTIDQTGSYDAIPDADKVRFSVSTKTALKAYAKLKSQGLQPDTDWNDYYGLKSMASSPKTKEAFLKKNLMEYRPKLADPEFKEVVNLQTQMRNGDDKAEKLLDGYRTDAMIVDGALRSIGIDTSKKASKSDIDKSNKFNRLVDIEKIKRQEATGKKATNEEMQEIVDNLMVEGITDKGIFWDTRQRVFEADPEKPFALSPDEIPTAERRKIEEALRKNGKPVDDRNVLYLYLNKLEGIRNANK